LSRRAVFDEQAGFSVMSRFRRQTEAGHVCAAARVRAEIEQLGLGMKGPCLSEQRLPRVIAVCE
jgi:hypothetical protein